MSTIGTLPTSIPYLEPNGANWAIFMMRFRDAMKVARRWVYFTGQKPCPKPQDPNHPTEGEVNAAEKWEYEDSVASFLLFQRLSDSTVMRLSKCCSAHEQWEMVAREYQAKSAHAQANLHQAFLEMRCWKGEDVREFLASLCYRKEELAAAGVHVTEKEYEHTILRGIPSELATFASHLLSSALLAHGTSTVNLDALISQVCEEADRLKTRHTSSQPHQGKNKPETAVFVATEHGEKTQCTGKCHKCSEEGHWARECCTPKRKGNATAPVAQASLGATPPPEAQHVVGETHTVLDVDVAGEFWLAEEEVAHAQIVDAEPDLTWGHLENSAADAHAQFVSAEPEPWLGKPDSLEDDAHAHLESAEPEILMNTEEDWLQEMEEEETAEVIAAVDEEKDPHVDLQGLGVSHLTMLKGTRPLASPLSLHQPILSRIESPPRSPATETGTQAMRESGSGIDLESPPLDLPPLKGAAKPPDNTVPKQIQAPTKVERLLESLRGKNLRRATGQNSQMPVHALEGMTPLGMAHGRPPDPVDSYARGSTVLEQNLVDPKAPVRMHQARRPVLDKGTCMHIDPWPDPGTIHTDPEAYFKVSALLEGEQNFGLPSVDSEQAVTSKILSFSCLPPVLLPSDTLERNLKPEGAEAEQQDAVQRPARLKLPNRIAKDPDKAGGVWPESNPVMLDCPQPVSAIEKGNIEAPNSSMVEAKRKAKWPPRRLATEPECGPDWPPRASPHGRNPKAPKGTGTCKPEDELATLKCAAPGYLEGKTSYSEGEPLWKGLADPESPHFEATEPRTWASSPAEKDDTLQGHRHCRHRCRDKACRHDAWQVMKSQSHTSRVLARVANTWLQQAAQHTPRPSTRSPEHPCQYKQNISRQSWTMCEMRGSVGVSSEQSSRLGVPTGAWYILSPCSCFTLVSHRVSS